MGEDRPTDDPALADRGWRGYDWRAGVPVVVVAAVASAGLLVGRWELDELSAFADRVGALAVFALAVAVWPLLLARLAYRTVTYTYRLTDRAVLLDYGFLHRPEPPVWLKDVTRVEAGATWVGRRLGVGCVTLTAGLRVVRLIGVRHPAAFAGEIRTAAGKR